jgi:hypothetical protein
MLDDDNDGDADGADNCARWPTAIMPTLDGDHDRRRLRPRR